MIVHVLVVLLVFKLFVSIFGFHDKSTEQAKWRHSISTWIILILLALFELK
jgi:uncharacterized membrane protein YecN with MAPEG domain